MKPILEPLPDITEYTSYDTRIYPIPYNTKMAFRVADHYIFISSQNTGWYLLDLNTGKITHTRELNDPVGNVPMSSSGQTYPYGNNIVVLVTIGSAYWPMVINPLTNEIVHSYYPTLPDSLKSIQAVSSGFTPNVVGNKLYVAGTYKDSATRTIVVIDLDTFEPITGLPEFDLSSIGHPNRSWLVTPYGIVNGVNPNTNYSMYNLNWYDLDTLEHIGTTKTTSYSTVYGLTSDRQSLLWYGKNTSSASTYVEAYATPQGNMAIPYLGLQYVTIIGNYALCNSTSTSAGGDSVQIYSLGDISAPVVTGHTYDERYFVTYSDDKVICMLKDYALRVHFKSNKNEILA